MNKDMMQEKELKKTIKSIMEDILYNEGGDGYLPEVITKEKYDWAKKILSY